MVVIEERVVKDGYLVIRDGWALVQIAKEHFDIICRSHYLY